MLKWLLEVWRIILGLLLIKILLGIGVFIYFKFYKHKVDFREKSEIVQDLKSLSASSKGNEFTLEEGKCIVKAMLEAGDDTIKSFEVKIYFKSNPMLFKEEVKEKADCLKFGVKTFITIFESKKTKQEFIKLSKALFIEFSGKQEVKKRFFNKHVDLKVEGSYLMISIN